MSETKAVVRQSKDRLWPKWAVIYPERTQRTHHDKVDVRWFDSESQALLAADDYNGEHYL